MQTNRYLTDRVKSDLETKMVFLAGPRQVGKTTLSKAILPNIDNYFNWDITEQRESILTHTIPPNMEYIIFDEIHKYPGWRNFLKGYYDKNHPKTKILVTGSARLDLYRYNGDSLQGRYFFWRLNPLSVAELGNNIQNKQQLLLDLLKYGGFPEPFFTQSEEFSARWSRQYRSLLVREEIGSLEDVKNIAKLELLGIRLPELVGSTLSINTLREDLEISHQTVAAWIEIFEKMYSLIRLYPFGAPIIKAVKKESKHYHFDWTLVKKVGARFENLIAIHLHKYVQYEQDAKGRNLELRFFRDIDKREVDFVITEDLKPIMFVECKTDDSPIDSSLKYLKNKFPSVESWQISATGEKHYESENGIIVAPAWKLLEKLV